MSLMPQEMEVWYVLPSLRRALAGALVADHKLPQKRVAELLGVTKAAVSQYLSSKRAKGFTFDPTMKREVREAAARIAKGAAASQELYTLCSAVRRSGSLCKLHKGMADIDKKCTICMHG
jgi:predicted transcriptional regulator